MVGGCLGHHGGGGGAGGTRVRGLGHDGGRGGVPGAEGFLGHDAG